MEENHIALTTEPLAASIESLSSKPSDHDHMIAVKRTQQIFKYLDELNQRRNPVRRSISDQLWSLWLSDLPSHSSVQTGEFDEQAAGLVDGVVVRVGRALRSDPPAPNEELLDWLLDGWDDPERTPKVEPFKESSVDDDDVDVVERFDDSEERVAEFADWQNRWSDWSAAERPARASLRLFEKLYELYGAIQREGEKLEFVLGDGILSWRRVEGAVYHPVILQRLQLEFDPDKPEFRLTESETPIELYTALFRGMDDVDGAAIGKCRDELDTGQFHPLAVETTSGFLRRFAATIASDGILEGEQHGRPTPFQATVSRKPVIFLRARTLGYAAAIEGVLSRLQDSPIIPRSLCAIVGVEAVPNAFDDVEEPGLQEVTVENDTDVLLSKPANPEQVQIARRLETHGCVLVQGPPGTGKTHTIANLIGHLLASGKSVLVTSQKANALKVVRAQVVPKLQPLCVSVTGSDEESRSQLETAVETIVERLSTDDPVRLESDASALAARRANLLVQLANLREELRLASFDEYRDIIVAGDAVKPSDAARYVCDNKDKQGWIPGPVVQGAPLTLTVDEVSQLYATASRFSAPEEEELERLLPDPAVMATPSDFASMAEAFTKARSSLRQVHTNLWVYSVADVTPTLLLDIASKSGAMLQFVLGEGTWMKTVIEAGKKGGPHRELWVTTVALINACYDMAAEAAEVLVAVGPTLVVDEPLEEQLRLASEIASHLADGKALGWIDRMVHRDWAKIIDRWKVGSRSPLSLADFEAIKTLAALQLKRQELLDRWDRLMGPLGGPPKTELGDRPEITAKRYAAHISSGLAWYTADWAPIHSQLSRVGFDWQALWKPPLTSASANAELDYLCSIVESDIIPALQDRAISLQCKIFEEEFTNLIRQLDKAGGQSPPSIVGQLRTAVTALDSAGYERAHRRLVDLTSKQVDYRRRHELIGRLAKAAPGWADATRMRVAPHDAVQPPGDPIKAWYWTQLQVELGLRTARSIARLQKSISDHDEELRHVTGDLVDRRAWLEQVKRTSLTRRQALMGWRDTIRRIGRGTGIRVPRLQAEARKLMSQSKESVPVWIMPLARVMESFDTRTTHFDVVIIDEASQCDVMGLIACFIADQVVVVGDHEQVSPDAVGEQLSEADQLIAQHLKGIPNSHLYDGKQSIYDLAMRSFGGTICLREHFRCVPDIIQFSNWLSYDGRIKPLRDYSGVSTRPFVVPVRVDGAAIKHKNAVEAETIVSLVVAALERPEYKDATFGVISLVGDKGEQSAMIEIMLKSRLGPSLFEHHKIQCGIAPDFQGDERDVVFLSMVDSPVGGPHSLRQTDQFKKRYNVAASRAKDQLWVVHSLNSDVDLKPGDLRRHLIEYSHDPNAFGRSIDDSEARTESEFERQVLRLLSARGYKVTPQWKVGGYRIDMVVEGEAKRLAVECDGDRYHYTVEHVTNDMQRQAILERLGWSFVRVRGSDFFRNPDVALQPVFAALDRMDIQPTHLTDKSATEAMARNELADHLTRRAAEIRLEWAVERETSFQPVVPEEKPCDDPDDNSSPGSYDNNMPGGAHELSMTVTPYVQFEMPNYGAPSRFYELAGAASPILTQRLIDIVDIEGPIHLDEATRRLVSGWGMKKAGSGLIKQVETIALRAQALGKLKIQGEFLWPVNSITEIVRGPSSDGSYRPAHEIALEEIAAACMVVMRTAQACSYEWLIVSIARIFGYRSTKRTIRTRLEAGVKLCQDDKLIKVTDGYSVLLP